MVFHIPLAQGNMKKFRFARGQFEKTSWFINFNIFPSGRCVAILVGPPALCSGDRLPKQGVIVHCIPSFPSTESPPNFGQWSILFIWKTSLFWTDWGGLCIQEIAPKSRLLIQKAKKTFCLKALIFPSSSTEGRPSSNSALTLTLQNVIWKSRSNITRRRF